MLITVLNASDSSPIVGVSLYWGVNFQTTNSSGQVTFMGTPGLTDIIVGDLITPMSYQASVLEDGSMQLLVEGSPSTEDFCYIDVVIDHTSLTDDQGSFNFAGTLLSAVDGNGAAIALEDIASLKMGSVRTTLRFATPTATIDIPISEAQFVSAPARPISAGPPPAAPPGKYLTVPGPQPLMNFESLIPYLFPNKPGVTPPLNPNDSPFVPGRPIGRRSGRPELLGD